MAYEPTHFGRAVQIVNAIVNLDSPTLAAVSESTGIPRRTIQHILKRLKREYAMEFGYIEGNRAHGFLIHNFGILNPQFLDKYDDVMLEKFPELFENSLSVEELMSAGA